MFRRALCLTLALTVIGGCGWHLRGTSDRVVFDTLAVEGGSADLRFGLAEALEDDGVLVHDFSPTRLVLSEPGWSSRTVAVDSAGRTVERELRMHLDWRLLGEEGPLSERAEMIIVRRYQVSPTSITGAEDEDALARADMIREAVTRLQQVLAVRSRDLVDGHLVEGDEAVAEPASDVDGNQQ